MLYWIFLATFAFFWYVTRKKEKKGQKEIPGPKGYPVVGNLLQIGKANHLKFNKWTEEYGEIYKFNLASQLVIMISNPKMVKEMLLNDPNYVGRPQVDLDIYEGEKLEPLPQCNGHGLSCYSVLKSLKLTWGNTYTFTRFYNCSNQTYAKTGIINSEGELWEVHRRFLLRELRNFGYAKSAMENLILEEVNEIISRFKKSGGKPITDIKKTTTLAVINSLWSVVGGQVFKHDDPKLMKLVDNTNKMLEDLFKSGALLLFIPWLKYILPESLSGYKAVREIFDDNRNWFEEMVQEHKETYREDNLRDFIDVYLSEMKKTEDPNSVFYGAPAERQLVAILSDLFFAGTDTTSSTLAWAFLYLCKYPETQRKLQQEITDITNNSRNVSVGDRPSMPYTLALIDEVLRLSSIVPDGVQHRAIEGKEFHGYYIPKGAWIMVNMHYMHHDPEVWGDPETFRPERFLSQDGKKHQKHEYLLPFQIGRRQCVGETLARDTIFLVLTNIFQRFEISFDPNSPEPSFDPKPNFILSPFPYSIVLKDRLE